MRIEQQDKEDLMKLLNISPYDPPTVKAMLKIARVMIEELALNHSISLGGGSGGGAIMDKVLKAALMPARKIAMAGKR